MIDTDLALPNFDSLPCMGEADTFELMQGALPCRCGSRNLMPGSDLDYPPTLCIMCLDCERMAGFAGTLAAAVKIWNVWSQTPPSRHAWAGTEGDDGEVCVLCGATPDDSNRDAPCPDDIEQLLIADEPLETGLADDDPQPHLRHDGGDEDGG